ncbi:hypothetical protein HY636_05125 [Candidatus Woesearchaeota archaeon]|nr:hypothetical protein [Candidatus Woesearchaeota archaeon]
MNKSLSIIGLLFAACTTQPQVKYTQMSPEQIQGFNNAYKELEEMCNQPWTKERRREGETPKEFGKRFCTTYGEGQYRNFCRGDTFDPNYDWYHITCETDLRCMVLIDGKLPCTSQDYCGKYD